MTAIILAAGSGRRLKIQKPKGMLIVGEKPLIQHSIDCLNAVGVEKIIIVTGYKSEFYESYFNNRHNNVFLVHNSEYANCGSLYSLFVALEESNLNDDVVVLDSDIIYNYDEFADFMKNSHKNAILATNVPDNRHDACYIEADMSDHLVKITKNINYITDKDNPWEYIGITKTSFETIKLIKEYAANLFKDTGTIDHEYDYVFENINAIYQICRYKDYVWTESDDNEQLNYLITNVYPKLNLFYDLSNE
jgi:choline kinase